MRLLFREAATASANNGSGALLDNVVLEPDNEIKGRLFVDSNRDNGELDSSGDPEAPLAGQAVELLDANGSLLQSTTTDENGQYVFKVSTGTYKVKVPTSVLGLSLVDPDIGDWRYDSDFSPQTGIVTSPLFMTTDAKSDVDAGYNCFSNDDSNHLCNGSFELNAVPSGQTQGIQYQSIPGWKGRNSQTDTLTLFNSVGGVDAPDGSNYLELDSHGGLEGFYQDVPTVLGEVYILSWRMRAVDSAKADTEDEAVVVSVKCSSALSCLYGSISRVATRHCIIALQDSNLSFNRSSGTTKRSSLVVGEPPLATGSRS